MEQLHEVSCWLPGELLDMPCCQTDLGVRIDEEGAGERDGRGEAFGDGAGDRGQVSLCKGESPPRSRGGPPRRTRCLCETE